MAYNTYPIPPQSLAFSNDTVLKNGYLQQSLYTQPNHALDHAPNNTNSGMQKPNDPYFNEMLEKHYRDLAIMFKETFCVELKDKTLVCQKPYPEIFFHVSQFNTQMVFMVV